MLSLMYLLILFLHFREANVLETSKIDTGVNETRFLVTGLKPFSTYSFKVSAENKIGFSVPSKESFQTQTHRESKCEMGDLVNLKQKLEMRNVLVISEGVL